jgi:hypothetical protein
MKYVNISSSLEKKFRDQFLMDHSKFIHASWCLKEDIDKKTTIDGVEFTIVGLWDVAGIRRNILLRTERGSYAFEDSKIVSQGMGFFNMRNLVTGKEHPNWVFGGKQVATILESTEDTSKEESTEDIASGVWSKIDNESLPEDEDTDEVEEIDPLVKALQQDISDEDQDY